jgi:hypothetical protein
MGYHDQLFARQRPTHLTARALLQGYRFVPFESESGPIQAIRVTRWLFVVAAVWDSECRASSCGRLGKPVSLIAQACCQHRRWPLAHGLPR